MLVALVLLLTIAQTPFQSSLDQAFGMVQNRDWKAAMTALDRAWTEDSAAFEANNLHYLRGRIAEEQKDWLRATEEFGQVGSRNPLRPLAAWPQTPSRLRSAAQPYPATGSSR